MKKIDLITGFLGAGKTSFIRKYAEYLISQGQKICILENDFGAINIDRVLLKELEEKGCDIEMVIGGDGYEAHRRRFKTKLIAMGMKDYDRILIEPSGVFDADEFFDVLYEEPLDQWYSIGSVITVVDAGLDENLSHQSEYMLASQAADAGIIVFSKSEEKSAEDIRKVLSHVNSSLARFNCKREIKERNTLAKPWSELDDADFRKIIRAEYVHADMMKLPLDRQNEYSSVFYFDIEIPQSEIESRVRSVLMSAECGNVIRVKGFVKTADGFMEVNADRHEIKIAPVNTERACLIIIGEKLVQSEIDKLIK